MEILKKLADFGFDKLCSWMRDMNSFAVSEDGGFGFMANLTSGLSSIMPFIWLGIMFFFVFFGKKLLPYIKFVSIAALGIAAGLYIVYPAIQSVGIPAILSAVVIGVLAAIFYRLIYIFVFAGAIFYTVFTACNSGFGDLFAEMGDIMLFVYVAVAVIAVIVAFILRKYTEMLATAMIGAYAISVQVLTILGNPAIDPSWLLPLIITLVVGFIGFFVQVKTRRRY